MGYLRDLKVFSSGFATRCLSWISGITADLPGGERGVVASVPGLVDGVLARARPGVLDASLTEKLRQCGVELM